MLVGMLIHKTLSFGSLKNQDSNVDRQRRTKKKISNYSDFHNLLIFQARTLPDESPKLI